MRTIVLLAILAVGLLVAGLVVASLFVPPDRPQTIHNPYVKP
jgi:hypothetical protein